MFSANSSQVSNAANYIEDVFSTYLYTGEGAAKTITNGIDLAGKGGLVWTKARSSVSGAPTYYTHELTDTVRGANNGLTTSTTAPQSSSDVNGFTSTGFNLTYSTGRGNAYDINEVSWTFRKQPKFFDIVTYTGDSTAGRTISHNLGSVPGCIIVKATNGTSSWFVYHQSLGNTSALFLQATNAAATSSAYWNNTSPTSTEFTLGGGSTNTDTVTYVAYIFAHNAGGFGLTGSDNVISCGSFTTDGSGLFSVTLGYEPQWVMVKRTSGVSDWTMFDTMRGMPAAAASGVFSATLLANTSAAEDAAGGTVGVNATGFNSLNGYLASSSTFIYIAIRRGPMKVPTSGTSVFNSITRTGTGTAATITGVGFAPDLVLGADRTGANTGDDCRYFWVDKLRGRSQYLNTAVTAAEVGASSSTQDVTAFGMDGISVGTTANAYFNVISDPLIHHYFKRAPSFFDEVCVKTSGYEVTATHNLGVNPELIIGKARNGTGPWLVWASAVAALNVNNTLILNTTAAATNNGCPINTVTATSFYAAIAGVPVETEVFYLFATCAGVSKVGSYTGTATTKQIDCGFTSGARFVLIKRTDSTGNWYVWDSARGIVAGNDPYLLLNAYAPAENTSTDYVDTYSAGFEISSTAPAAINASGGSFIFLAVA